MSILEKTLTINEIFFSIQGESYLAGLPCVFVRLTGCHQRCSYCDSEYAFYEGKKMSLKEIISEVKKYNCRNILITGGEPLLQTNTPDLMNYFLKEGYQVAVETGGNRDLAVLPDGVVKIMDLKTPGSGEQHNNNLENLKKLNSNDEIKFVVTNEKDIDWAIEQTKEFHLCEKSHVSLSPIDLKLLPVMAEKIINSGEKIRLQMQFHKLIWPSKDRGY